ncbi:MAG: NUDIX hydrolase [Phaeodactylibacter sp.]|nr:NUDIX hydrolase [Phaeodactylibacter sp.]MCB9275495.1 NUDIX hydrolase [Lewinellaceae bacterium]
MPGFATDQLLQGLSVDCVIFGFHQNELKVLLLKLKQLDMWALPGGFVGVTEDVDQAATRVLSERTGLEDIFLQQFFLFGDASRHRAGHGARLAELGAIPAEWADWLDRRFVTLGYYALVEYSRVKAPKPDQTSESCEWCALNALPKLMLDHSEILTKAHDTLKKHLNDQPIGLNLLPAQFTMPELQALYETVLGTTLDRRNFQRKMLGYGILNRTGKRMTGAPHKAPWLYEFDEEKYRLALQAGLNTGW